MEARTAANLCEESITGMNIQEGVKDENLKTCVQYIIHA